MNVTALTGIALVATLAVVGYTSSQNPSRKDVRLEKGTVPGGVTLFGSNEVTRVPKNRSIATFGSG